MCGNEVEYGIHFFENIKYDKAADQTLNFPLWIGMLWISVMIWAQLFKTNDVVS